MYYQFHNLMVINKYPSYIYNDNDKNFLNSNVIMASMAGTSENDKLYKYILYTLDNEELENQITSLEDYIKENNN